MRNLSAIQDKCKNKYEKIVGVKFYIFPKYDIMNQGRK